MSSSGPSSWGVFWAITRLGLLRWGRRLTGRIKTSKSRQAKPAKRKAVGRKRRWPAGLTLGVMVPFLLIVVINASRLVGALSAEASRVERPGQMGVSIFFHRDLLEAEEGASTAPVTSSQASAEPVPPAPAPDDVRTWRENVLARLQSEMDREFFEGPPYRTGGGERAKQQFTTLYLEHGSDAIAVNPPPKVDVLPHPGLWPEAEAAGRMRVSLAVVLTAVFAFLLSSALVSSQDISGGRWDMEWLFSLPLRARMIFLADLAKEAFSSPTSWVVALPVLWVMLVCGGVGWWWSVPLALAAAAYVVALVEAIRLPLEVWLRQRLSPARLRNLLAGMAVLSLALLVGLIAAASGGLGVRQVGALGRVLPEGVIWMPWTLPLGLCTPGVPWAATLAVMAALGVAVVYGAPRLAERAVRDGLIAQGSSGRARVVRRGRGGLPLPGMLGKELLLLARDRTYMARALVLPVALAIFQIAINPRMLTAAQRNITHASALAFGLGAYMLLISGTRLLVHEGTSLWLLHTFPKTLVRMLLTKAVLWSIAAAVLAAGILLTAGVGGAAVADRIVSWVTVLVGVGLFGMITAAVGALACDPLETRPNKQVSVSATYLLLLIMGLYAGSFYTPSLYAKAVTVAVFALVAVAFWQKARARLPYLLDPTSLPPPSLDLGDALLAVFAFFAVQGIVTTVLILARVRPAEAAVWGYSVAAVAVGVGSVVILAVRRIPHLLSLVGLTRSKENPAPLARSLMLAMGLGLAAGGVGMAYLWVASQIPGLRAQLEQPTLWTEAAATERVWFVLLMLVAAPICEEYLFRGLLLRSLQRSTGFFRAAAVSSAVFALMHPPVAAVPVFVLGLAAAMSFRRGTLLAAPIVCHLTYNAVLVTAAFWGR